MAKGLGRFRRRMASGLVVLIPLVVTVYVLKALFGVTAGILLPIINPAVDHWPPLARTGLSLGILFVVVYGLGELAAHLLGRRALALAETVLLRVPLVRVIYGASKQVVSAFERRDSSAFKSVVFIEFPRPGLQSLGFVTSSYEKPDGSKWKTVFVPTTPNPTTGFLQVVKSEELVSTDFTIEEAFKMVISLGAVVPDGLRDLP
jgi:uncharacterized membrane protein